MRYVIRREMIWHGKKISYYRDDAFRGWGMRERAKEFDSKPDVDKIVRELADNEFIMSGGTNAINLYFVEEV